LKHFELGGGTAARSGRSIKGVLAFAFALFLNTFTVVFFFHQALHLKSSSDSSASAQRPKLLCKKHIELIFRTKIEAYPPLHPPL
jgi:hypothetical protein